MTEKNGAFIFTFTAKTAIWTGDADGQSHSLKHTGLLGSIRWWFEVVVRGLGGYACDPSQTECQYKQNDPTKKHCVVCELFGCTGWARKFRFDVLDEKDNHIQEQIKADDKFKLKFTPLRPIQEEEWALLSLTLKLIAKYGAIGGKTVYKPSNGIHKDKVHHKDFGLIELKPSPREEKIEDIIKLKSYVIASQWRKNDSEEFWASLENFWCVRNNFLEFSSFNTVLKEFKWLAGKQQESKRIFSFKNPPRIFGFVNPSEPVKLTHEAMRKELKNKAWSRLTDEEYIHGVDKILISLIQQLRRSKP